MSNPFCWVFVVVVLLLLLLVFFVFFFLVVCWLVTVVSPFTLGTRNEEVGSDEDDIARKRWESGKISNLIFFFNCCLAFYLGDQKGGVWNWRR